MRGLAELLPEIEVVADCPFGCDPARPACATCRARARRGGAARACGAGGAIVDLPLNATEDRVAGSIDIARALTEGERALEPGLLAEANRGILYVDEINLLDDHLADILLDAAALGVNVVEREGVSVSHPARFLLVGHDEPRGGRAAAADRRPHRPAGRGARRCRRLRRAAEVLRRREAFTRRSRAFAADWAGAQAELRGTARRRRRGCSRACAFRTASTRRSGRSSSRLGRRQPPRRHHRARVRQGASPRSTAARTWRPRTCGRPPSLALGHRLAGDPFAPDAALPTPPAIDDALDAGARGRGERQKKRRPHDGVPGAALGRRAERARPPSSEVSVDPRAVSSASAAAATRSSGRGSAGARASLVSRRAGQATSRHRLAEPRRRDRAFDATLRAAAVRGGRTSPIAFEPRTCVARSASTARRLRRRASWSTTATRCTPSDGRAASRASPSSCSRTRRTGATAWRSSPSGAASRRRPSRCRRRAACARARRRLEQVPLSGRTPLADALRRARLLLRRERYRHPNARAARRGVTDGAPTVPLRAGGDPLADTLFQARELARARVRVVVADAAAPGSPEALRGHARTIAEAARGTHVPLHELAPGLLAELLEERA